MHNPIFTPSKFSQLASLASLSNLVVRHVEHASNLIFPPRCLGCECYLTGHHCQNTDILDPYRTTTCQACRPTIYRLDGPGCPRCARPRASLPGKPPAGVDELCAACLDHLPAFEQARACFEYEALIADAIQCIKYGRQLHKIHPLTHLVRPWMLEKLAKIAQNHPDHDTLCLIPVPMHIRDLRRRGFNLTALMLRQITRKTPYIVDFNAVKKVRSTPAQAGLTRDQRLKNLHGAFTASAPKTPETTAVLFDDVLTTTATTHQISTALLNAGFRRVIVLTIARASGTGHLSDYF